MPGITGTRGIAALSVVFYHWSPLLQNPSALSAVSPGPYAVIFFFVLSGFLITTLLLREEDRSGWVDLNGFWLRRILRILPAFYVFLALQAILLHAFPTDLLVASFYVSNYFQALQGWHTSLLAHTWSLSVEEQFYFLWPMAFVFIRNRKRLKFVLLAGIILVQVGRALANHFGIPGYYTYFAFEFRSDALMIGCLMALHLKDNPKLPGWMLNRGLAICLLALFPALMLPHKSNFISSHIVAPFGYSLGAYASAILIIQAIAFAPAFLNNRVMNYLGALSYSIYLYHQMILDLSKHLLSSLSAPLVVCVYVLGTIAAASLSYFLVEKPFLSLKSVIEAWHKERSARPARAVNVPGVPDSGQSSFLSA